MKKIFIFIFILILSISIFSKRYYIGFEENEDLIVQLYVEKPDGPWIGNSSVYFEIIDGFDQYTNWFGADGKVYNYYIEIINKTLQTVQIDWDSSTFTDSFGNQVRPITFRPVSFSPFEVQDRAVIFSGGKIKMPFVPITDLSLNKDILINNRNFVKDTEAKFKLEPLKLSQNSMIFDLSYTVAGKRNNLTVSSSINEDTKRKINNYRFPLTIFGGYSMIGFNNKEEYSYNYEKGQGFEVAVNINNILDSQFGIGLDGFFYKYSFREKNTLGTVEDVSQYANDISFSLYGIYHINPSLSLEFGTGTYTSALQEGFNFNDLGIHIGTSINFLRNSYIALRYFGLINKVNILSFSIGYNF
ncbi:hypothetical protein C7380_10317 [Oceanotoga teriensis]|uniref:Uncharacterized protein n=1 Tax=Oceanotoga teriensis TaxID=515440 RepID=A0AA45HJE6_9BACT|nr:hypothetical protein [Oceanotoga teriensis]PWJ95840.1 hypothetical protein C7380_10317 [Oceanotoga teriensis]